MAADKLRLLGCYVATHPEQLDADKLGAWQREARLGGADVVTLTNLGLLGVPVMKRGVRGVAAWVP
jgi:syntaxin-binding protein 1